MSDATSLQDLNDIVLPAAVAWWPLAPGWYVLAALFFVFALGFGLRWWRRWQNDRYRRVALSALQTLRDSGDPQSLQRIPELLKRTALACWPRSQVAALSGQSWHEFLDRSSSGHVFRGGAGNLLDRLAYDDGQSPVPGDADSAALFAAAEYWLKRHRKARVPAESC